MYKRLITLCGIAVLCASCGGGGGGSSCSNLAGEICPEGEYCKFEIGQCGVDGSCEPIPPSCDPGLVTPVCSCEGISFFNDCFAAQAGQSVQSAGDCP